MIDYIDSQMNPATKGNMTEYERKLIKNMVDDGICEKDINSAVELIRELRLGVAQKAKAAIQTNK